MVLRVEHCNALGEGHLMAPGVEYHMHTAASEAEHHRDRTRSPLRSRNCHPFGAGQFVPVPEVEQGILGGDTGAGQVYPTTQIMRKL